HAPLRFRPDRQTPHDRERPDSIGQVKRRRENSGDVEGVDPGIPYRRLHLAKEVEALVIVQLHEARRPVVKEDEGEHDDAGHALEEVHPVAHVSVGDGVGLRGARDEEAIDAVEQQRDRDDEDLERDRERDRLELVRHLVVSVRAAGRLIVLVKMKRQETADRHDARKGVQTSKPEMAERRSVWPGYALRHTFRILKSSRTAPADFSSAAFSSEVSAISMIRSTPFRPSTTGTPR